MRSVPSVLIIKEFEMTKPFVVGFIVGVALLIVAGVGASRLQRRDATRIDAEAEERKYQVEIVDATPVQFGVLSDKQRVHSKLYTHYQQVRNGRTIHDLIEQARGKSKIIRTGVFPGLGPRLEPKTAENYFGELTLASDVVILGTVIKKASQITEDNTFIFTDYTISILEVLKNNLTAPLDVGAMITVTRPGGKILVNDIIVQAIDESFEPLPFNNHKVLLFLNFIPETASYKATRDTGSLELDGSSIRPLGGNLPPGVLTDEKSLLTRIRTVINK